MGFWWVEVGWRTYYRNDGDGVKGDVVKPETGKWKPEREIGFLLSGFH
jgi:hypothetical protein